MSRRPYQKIGEMLRNEIAQGHYRVGDKLPAEREIAERLQVSRAVVRDAMIMLELEQLVEVRKGSGIYIIGLPEVDTGQNLSDTSASQPPEIGPFEMLQARQLIESHVAEFAATQITISDVKRIQAALEEERRCIVDGEDNDIADKKFHLAIAEATQNTALVDTVMRLWTQRESSEMWSKLQSHITDKNYRELWLKQHESIFFALKKKNPDAAKTAMWEHLESVKQTLLRLADADEPGFDGFIFSDSPVSITR